MGRSKRVKVEAGGAGEGSSALHPPPNPSAASSQVGTTFYRPFPGCGAKPFKGTVTAANADGTVEVRYTEKSEYTMKLSELERCRVMYNAKGKVQAKAKGLKGKVKSEKPAAKKLVGKKPTAAKAKVPKEKQAKRKRARGASAASPASHPAGGLSSKWVACEDCGKWRRVPEGVQDEALEGFVCADNVAWDAARATCGAAEEVAADDEETVEGEGGAEVKEAAEKAAKAAKVALKTEKETEKTAVAAKKRGKQGGKKKMSIAELQRRIAAKPPPRRKKVVVKEEKREAAAVAVKTESKESKRKRTGADGGEAPPPAAKVAKAEDAASEMQELLDFHVPGAGADPILLQWQQLLGPGVAVQREVKVAHLGSLGLQICETSDGKAVQVRACTGGEVGVNKLFM